MQKKLQTWGFISTEAFILLISLILFIFGYNRIKSTFLFVKDPFALHFGEVGLMYFIIGIPLLILFFILLILKIAKK